MAKIDHDPDAPSDWLEALHEAVAAGRDDQFEHPELDTVAEDHIDAVRDCFRLLERVRRARDSSIAGQTANACENGAASDAPRHVGRFRIVRELGRGGFGIVFLAFDPRIGRNVALKVPRPEILVAPSMRRRFLREAEAAGALEHPNLIPIYEVGEQGPVCYIASAYCAGPNLSRWLADRSDPVPIRSAAQVVGTLARGVEHAHRRGVLHRDIKPANVLLEPASEQASVDDLSSYVPRLTDFGLAKVLEASSDETRTGALLGTPAYMAPEQAEGRLPDIGPSTDVYALGVLLYELLVGRPPFRGQSDVQTLQQVSRGDPLRPNRFRQGLSKDLEAIVLKCLEHDPARRYGSATEMADDLDRFLAGAPTLARPAGSIEIAAKWVRRRPAIASLLSVVVVAALLLAGGGWWYSGRLRAALEESRDHELTAKRLLHVANVNLAERALASDNVRQARELLARDVPRNDEPDLRGFAWHHLQRRLNDEELTLRGHTREIYCVRFAPNGLILATSSQDQTARVWDSVSGKCLSVLTGHTSDVNSVAFSADSKLLASASDDCTVRIWDLATNEVVHTLAAHERGVNGVAFSSDDANLATCGRDKNVRLWSTSNWQQVALLEGHADDVGTVVFSPKGDILVTASDDRTVRVWDVATGQSRLTHAGYGSAVSSVAVSRDGRQILSAGRQDHVVRVWEAATGAKLRDYGASLEWIHAAIFLNQDKQIVVGAKDGAVSIIDVITSEVVRKLAGHGERVWSVALSPDERHLATASADRTVKIWNLSTGASHESFSNTPGVDLVSLALTPDGEFLASGSSNGHIAIRQTASRQVCWQAGGFFEIIGDFNGDGHEDGGDFQDGTWHLRHSRPGDGEDIDALTAQTVVFGTGSDVPIVGDWDGDGRDNLGVYRPFDGTWHFDLDGQGGPAENTRQFGTPESASRNWGVVNQIPLVGHWDAQRQDQIGLATYTANGWQIALASAEGDITYRIEHGDRYSIPIAGCWDNAGFDGVSLLDGQGKLWIDVARSGGWPEFVIDLPGYGPPRRIHPCNLPEFEQIVAVDKPSLTPAAIDAARDVTQSDAADVLAIAPNGELLAVNHSRYTRVHLWNARSGAKLADLRPRVGNVNALAFAPDGRTLAIGAQNGEITFCDLKTYAISSHKVLDDICFMRLAYSPNGELLAASGNEGVIKIWDVTGRKVLMTLRDEAPYDILSLGFSPDGTLVAAAGISRVINLWNVAAGRKVAALTGHNDQVNTLSFSPDGGSLASGGNDGSVKLWDLATSQELYSLHDRFDCVNAIVFHPDGRQLIGACHANEGGSLHFWSTGPAAAATVDEPARISP